MGIFNCANVGEIGGEVVALLTAQDVNTVNNRPSPDAHSFTQLFAFGRHLALDSSHLLEAADLLVNVVRIAFVLDGGDGALHHVLAYLVEEFLVASVTSLLGDQHVRRVLLSCTT